MSKLPISTFLAQAQQLPGPVQTPYGRLVFALDATASRQPTWDQACHIQSDMFLSTQALGQLQVQLCYYRGYKEFYFSEWLNRNGLAKQMQGVECLGGYTQIGRLLKHVLVESTSHKINAVVFVGDCVEEAIETLCDYAGQLALRGIPLFIFQEGQDNHATCVFDQLAKLSGGVHVPFNTASARRLQNLLKAVAVYAVGGYKALRHLKNTENSKAANELLLQLSKSQDGS